MEGQLTDLLLLEFGVNNTENDDLSYFEYQSIDSPKLEIISMGRTEKVEGRDKC